MPQNGKRQINRRGVLESIGSIAAISGLPLAAGAKERYPTVEHELSDEKIETLAINTSNDALSNHPKHDRVAFTTDVFSNSIELYVGAGASSSMDVASEIYQITSGSSIGILELQWLPGNRLQFWRDGTRYIVKIPPSYKVFEAEVLEQTAVPGDPDNEEVVN